MSYIEIQRLKVEYWTKRLDHTIQYTQTATRLVYILGGAVLAFMSVVSTRLGLEGLGRVLICTGLVTLALINSLHARLIRIQHGWYHHIRHRLELILDEVDLGPGCPDVWFPQSTHACYVWIQRVVSIALVLACLVIIASAAPSKEKPDSGERSRGTAERAAIEKALAAP